MEKKATVTPIERISNIIEANIKVAHSHPDCQSVIHGYNKAAQEIFDFCRPVSASPDPDKDALIEALRKANAMIGSLKRSMLVHPDCTEGSEFDDYTTWAQETEDEIDELLSLHDSTTKGE